jgi:hypothetical protein
VWVNLVMASWVEVWTEDRRSWCGGGPCGIGVMSTVLSLQRSGEKYDVMDRMGVL